MWSGLKNALEMFHSFSMARPWSEGPLAAGRSDCVQAAEPNEDPSSATEAALVIAPASPLFAPPIIAAAPTPITFAATIVAPPIVAPAPSAAPRCAGERSVPRRHPQPRAGRVQGERGRRREEIAQ